MKALLESKKFIASALASLIAFFASREGLPWDQIAMIITPLLAYVGAQGVADIGKERIKTERLVEQQKLEEIRIAVLKKGAPPAALLLCAVLLSSCIGNKIDPALFQPALNAWPSVRADVERGLADGLEDGDLDSSAHEALETEVAKVAPALETGKRSPVRSILWTTLRPWADRGIEDKLDDGEIGPGVADSLRLRVSLFSETILRLQAF